METEGLVKEFIGYYNYGPCVMFGVDNFDVYVLWRHWTFVNLSEAPKVYLGKNKKTKNLKPIYKWLD